MKSDNTMSFVLPRAILFDWDSTLAQTKATVVAALEQTLAHFNLPAWKEVKNLRHPLLSLKDNFPLIFSNDSDAAYQYYLKIYQFKNTKPTPYAQEFLEFCQAQNIDIYIVSNKEKSLLLKEVSFCYPNIKFKNILAHGDAKENKPSAAPVFEALKNAPYPIDYQNVWLVGDSMPDTECAKNAGIQGILIGNNIKDEAYLKQLLSTAVPIICIDNFKELITLLKNKNQ